jgi:hypothetical protein
MLAGAIGGTPYTFYLIFGFEPAVIVSLGLIAGVYAGLNL